MRYKCFVCDIEFATIEELARHKQQHQAGSQSPSSPSGVLCLGCGKTIPIDHSRANYSGPLTCPGCHSTMTVVIEDGEVAISRLG